LGERERDCGERERERNKAKERKETFECVCVCLESKGTGKENNIRRRNEERKDNTHISKGQECSIEE